jgi:hypothetical protein
MQVKNQWENAKLTTLNKKASTTTVADFVTPPQIKQKLILIVVTCVGDCYWSLLLTRNFPEHSINIQDIYINNVKSHLKQLVCFINYYNNLNFK